MTYEQGLALFKSANYRAAAEQFAAVTEADENNHKAWNALAICLSKIGEYDQAHTCFENALTLSPDNATYRKNFVGNAAKKRKKEPGLALDDEPAQPVKKLVTIKQTAPNPLSFLPAWSMGQYAIGVVAVFIVLMLFLGCVSSLGGHSSNTAVSPAAGSTSPVKTAAPTNNLNGFTVTDAQFQKEQYTSYVTGSIVNTKNKKLSYLQVEINLYDQSGAQVGSTLANVNNLEPGGVWKFKAVVFQTDAVDYKIKEITGW